MIGNENQLAIINADDAPLLVVAGPGAGKTYVLEQRVRRLFGIEPDRHFKILAITFTNVAAANLKHRLEDLKQSFEDRLEIGTFHAFAARILQQHGSHIGLSSDFSIISADEDRLAILKEAMESIGSEIEPRSALPLIARRFERGLLNGQSRDILNDGSENAVADYMRAYRNVSIARGQLDFSLLIYVTLELLTTYPALGRVIRKAYRFICVDEFQDTNEAQFELLTLISAANNRGLLFLADQDQVIYQWNGASPRRLREAQERFEMKVLLLPTSYRCPSNILEAANRLISRNSLRFVSPRFEAANNREGEISIQPFNSQLEESSWIVSELAKEDDPTNVVVLARNRSLLEGIARGAEQAGVRAAIPINRYEFESAPLAMLHSMLRLANVSDNARALERLAGAFFQMTRRLIDPAMVKSLATSEELNPLIVFFRELLPVARFEEFRNLASVVENELVERRYFRNVSKVFFDWVDRIAATDWATTAYWTSYEEERVVWNEFEIMHRGLSSENVTLGEFLRTLDLESKAPPQPDHIKLLTVHAAKGLEFGRVYIAGASDGQFPAFQAVKLGDQSEAMEEERRSFFVAITRSRSQLFVTYSKSVRGYLAQPSRFLKEMAIISPG